jgi:hypothetical protein
VSIVILLLIAFAIVAWPSVVDSIGTRTSGVITEKIEVVRIFSGDWFRHFEIIASYSVPGQTLEHRAVCDVDESTYDSLRKGSQVVVHYLLHLLVQPFLPATHLSPCKTMASISVNTPVRHLALALVALLPILIFWRVFRIRSAVWLFLAWVGLTFAYVVMPRTEPEPQAPVSGTAVVDHIARISKLGDEERTDRGIPLLHPYQVVEFKFVPPGMDTAVTAVDKIDENSVPGLQEGQSAAIVYDAAHPRVARLRGGTRLFPRQARMTVLLLGGGFAVLIVILLTIRGVAGIARQRLGG